MSEREILVEHLQEIEELIHQGKRVDLKDVHEERDWEDIFCEEIDIERSCVKEDK